MLDLFTSYQYNTNSYLQFLIFIITKFTVCGIRMEIGKAFFSFSYESFYKLLNLYFLVFEGIFHGETKKIMINLRKFWQFHNVCRNSVKFVKWCLSPLFHFWRKEEDYLYRKIMPCVQETQQNIWSSWFKREV